MQRNRRAFLKDVGRGMIVASVGPALAADLFPGTLRADDAPDRLTFGKLDSLVALMQDTPPDKLQPLLAERLRNGADLTTAHRRRRPGQRPRLRRRRLHRLPHHDGPRPGLPHGAGTARGTPTLAGLQSPLPQRRTCLQGHGGAKGADTLRPLKPADLPADKSGADALREAVERKDMAAADRTFAAALPRQARRRLQRTSALRAGGTGGPPRRPAASRLDPGRHHRHEPRPGAAPPVGALLRPQRVRRRTRPRGRAPPPATCCRSCSTSTNSRANPPGRRRRRTPGWTR